MIIRIIRGWWYSFQFQKALKKEKLQRANYLLKKLEFLKSKITSICKVISTKVYRQKMQFVIINKKQLTYLDA